MFSLIEIDKNKKTVSVILNTNFYPKEKIEKAAKEFSEACKVRIENIKNPSPKKQNSLKLLLTPKKKGIDLNTLGYEFCNYLLAEIKSQ